MAHEQAFEEHGEEGLPSSHRQWQAGHQVEPDLAKMVDMYDVMTTVNQRLAEHRSQPMRRTVGDAVTASAFALLLVCITDPSSDFNFGVPLIICAIMLYNRNLHALDIAQAALNLQEFDRRWIGPLLEALSWPNRRIRQIARLKLLHLLPMITEEDSDNLSEKIRGLINSILEESQDTTLKLAILKAIVRFGDASAVSAVEKLAAQRIWTPADHRVRQEARICLPRLREQAQKQAELLAKCATANGVVPLGLDGLEASMDGSITNQPSQDSSALAKLEAEREKVANPAMRMGFLIANWCVIVPFSAYQCAVSFANHRPLLGLVCAGAAIGASQLYRVSLSTKRVAMVRKQVQNPDIRGVGLLAEALAWPEENLQNEAASALTVLLPKMMANNAALLSAPQRDCLHHKLTLQNAQSQSDLIVAILQAFQQVGDNAAIPYVERLAEANARTPQERKVVLEAQECLPYLRLRAGNNTARHTLLRASMQTEIGASDNLLRPSWENPETKPEQLLRPGQIDPS